MKGGKMPKAPVDHAKMDCCSAVCQTASAAALVPNGGGAAIHAAIALRPASAPARQLHSVHLSGTDPPPRA